MAERLVMTGVAELSRTVVADVSEITIIACVLE